MEPSLELFSRLGTSPPEPADTPDDESNVPCLGLTVRLDRPFHELKEHLLAEFERAYVLRCLTESMMNVSMASRTSGLSRKHLRTLMYKYGIRRPGARNDEASASASDDGEADVEAEPDSDRDASAIR